MYAAAALAALRGLNEDTERLARDEDSVCVSHYRRRNLKAAG